MKQSNNHIVFKAPANVVSLKMQKTINAFLNAEDYVCITSQDERIRIDCQSIELLLGAVMHMAATDKKIKEDLTNLVIELQRDSNKN